VWICTCTWFLLLIIVRVPYRTIEVASHHSHCNVNVYFRSHAFIFSCVPPTIACINERKYCIAFCVIPLPLLPSPVGWLRLQSEGTLQDCNHIFFLSYACSLALSVVEYILKYFLLCHVILAQNQLNLPNICHD
jgi:hypothetical protein